MRPTIIHQPQYTEDSFVEMDVSDSAVQYQTVEEELIAEPESQNSEFEKSLNHVNEQSSYP